MARILIVENDKLTLRLYQKAFKLEGYEVDTALNGEEGLKKIKRNKPILILSDIMMPKMDGIEMLKIIKSDSKYKNIPVVVLTSLSDEIDVEVALSEGAVKHIVKSKHKPKEIVDLVKGILAGYTRDEVPKTKVR